MERLREFRRFFVSSAGSCPQPPRSHSAASPSPRSRPTAQGDFGRVGTLRHCGGAREEKINWFIVCGLMNQLIPGTYEPINFCCYFALLAPRPAQMLLKPCSSSLSFSTSAFATFASALHCFICRCCWLARLFHCACTNSARLCTNLCCGKFLPSKGASLCHIAQQAKRANTLGGTACLASSTGSAVCPAENTKNTAEFTQRDFKPSGRTLQPIGARKCKKLEKLTQGDFEPSGRTHSSRFRGCTKPQKTAKFAQGVKNRARSTRSFS